MRLSDCQSIQKRRDDGLNELITFISQVGFPIVVSFYLLNRIEAKLDIMIQSIQNLSR